MKDSSLLGCDTALLGEFVPRLLYPEHKDTMTLCSLETLGTTDPLIQCHIPEDWNLQATHVLNCCL